MSKNNTNPNAAVPAALDKNELPLTGDAAASAVVNPVGETSTTVETQSGDQNGIAPGGDASASAVVNPGAETSATVETHSGDQNGTATAVVNPIVEKPKTGKTSEKMVKITFTLSPCGVFKLPYNVGQTVPINENQANVIVEAGYATFSK